MIRLKPDEVEWVRKRVKPLMTKSALAQPVQDLVMEAYLNGVLDGHDAAKGSPSIPEPR